MTDHELAEEIERDVVVVRELLVWLREQEAQVPQDAKQRNARARISESIERLIIAALRRVPERQPSENAERELAGLREKLAWYCGCGHTNGINLAVCAACGRMPGGRHPNDY